MTKIIQATDTQIGAKQASLAQALKKNESWVGAMMKLSSVELQIAADHTDLKQDDNGAVPWLVAVRHGALRFGPQEVPLPGIGAFVYARSDACHLWVIAVEPILKQGIAMTDVFAFLDSERGSHMLSDASFVTFASLKRGAFA